MEVQAITRNIRISPRKVRTFSWTGFRDHETYQYTYCKSF